MPGSPLGIVVHDSKHRTGRLRAWTLVCRGADDIAKMRERFVARGSRGKQPAAAGGLPSAAHRLSSDGHDLLSKVMLQI